MGECGFTLVEMIIVIALLGLVFALVLPRTGRADTLASASRRMIGTIHTLYGAASATQKTYRLCLDLDQQAYWAVVLEPDGERPPADLALAQRVTLPRHIRLQDATTVYQGKVGVGRALLQFYPVGRTERSVIHLADEAQNILTLIVNPLTGGVEVRDGAVEPAPPEPVSERLRPFLLPGLGPKPARL